MILGGQLLLDDGSCRCRIVPGFIRVEDGLITEVVEGEIPGSADHGGSQALISPGLIDAHLHLPQFGMMGAHGMPLLDWLSEVTFPAEMKWASPDFASGMTRNVVDQLFSVGTTCMCAYATVHHQSTIAAIDIAKEKGMRGVIGQVLMNRNAPTELCRETNRLINEAAELASVYPVGSRMSAAVTPRFAVSCTQELLAAAGKLAAERGAVVQSHLAETVHECKVVSELFDGQSYVEVYRNTDLMTSRSIFGHGIHLDNEDRHALAECGAVIAHCPTANSFLRSGTMRRELLCSDGVAVAIGSDIGAGYERSMVRVARAMIESASSIGDVFPDAATAWYGITSGNADALHLEDAGRLSVGASADVLVIEPTIEWLSDAVDPLSMLMFAWDDRWLSRTMVQGKVVHEV